MSSNIAVPTFIVVLRVQVVLARMIIGHVKRAARRHEISPLLPTGLLSSA